MTRISRIRVLLLIPHLGGGGAERVIELLARHLSCKKYELHLCLVTQTTACLPELPTHVAVHALSASRVRSGTFRLFRLFWNLKPDLILSGIAHLNFLILLLRPLLPRSSSILVRQNATVSAACSSQGHPFLIRLLYRLTYPHADRIICQSEAMAEDLRSTIRIPRKRIAALPNPVDIDGIRASIEERLPRRDPNDYSAQLLAVGRLAPEKGFDLLLPAFAIVRKRFPNADLTILGTGPEEAALKALARSLGLEAAVRFPGYIAQPWTYFAGASLFVLSSRQEGLPNALLEAAAAGLPLVAFPASGGIVDLLRGKPAAWLAAETTPDALAGSLLTALGSFPPGQRFAHLFVEEFAIKHSIQAYEALIDAVVEERSLGYPR
jgi:glycosyltransferase involved in cell wall biosynthesis